MNAQNMDVQHLNEALEEMRATIERLEDEHEADLQAVAQAIDAQLMENDKVLEGRLEKQRIFYEGRIADLECQLKKLHEEYSTLTDAESTSAVKTLNDNTERGDDLTSQVGYWREEHAKLSMRFQQLQREFESYMYNAQTSQEDEGATQQQEELHATHEVESRQNHLLQDRPESMDRFSHDIQDDVCDRDVQPEVLQSELEEMRARYAAEVAHLEERLEKRTKEVESLSQANDELRELIQHGASTVQAKLHEQNDQIVALNLEVEKLEEELSSSRDQVSQYAEMIEQLKGVGEEAQQQLLRAEIMQRDLNVQLQKAERHLREEKHVAAQKLEGVVREQERQQEQTRDHYTREIKNLQEELDRMRSELQAIQTTPATLPLGDDEEFEFLKERLVDALASNEELQASLRDARDEIRVLRGTEGHENSSQCDSTTPASGNDASADSLLRRIGQLESCIQELTNDRRALEQEKVELENGLKDAMHHAEMNEKTIQQQKSELQDLGLLRESSIELAIAYEELQRHSVKDAHYISIQKHTEALIMAKMVCVPRLLREYLDAIFSSLMVLIESAQKQRPCLNERFDAIEEVAFMALEEDERQDEASQVARADADQAQLARKKVD
ncbi:unnamed protein product, partial [Phytomonas sp. EM1]